MQAVKMLCEYHVVVGLTPVMVVRLTSTRIFLSNVFQVQIDCQDNITKTDVNHKQIVLEIGCQCSLTANEIFLPPVADLCELGNGTIAEFHPVNLRILHEYFSEQELLGLQAETLLEHQINISIPTLLLSTRSDNHKFQDQLAFEENAKFELQKMVNATKADKDSFQSLSEYLFQSILDDQMDQPIFQVFNIWHWISAISFIVAICAFGAVIFLSWRMRVLSAMMITQRVLGAVTGEQITSTSSTALRLPSVLHYRTSTAIPVKIVNETVISVSEILSGPVCH